MKNLKLALLCALSLPLSTLNAGLGYYAGRMAHGLTRAALVAAPAYDTYEAGRRFFKNDRLGQEEFSNLLQMQKSLEESQALLEKIKAHRQKTELSLKTTVIFGPKDWVNQMRNEARLAISECQDQEKIIEGIISRYTEQIGNGDALNQLKEKFSRKTNINPDDIMIRVDDKGVGVVPFKKANGDKAVILKMDKSVSQQYMTNPESLEIVWDHEAAHVTQNHVQKSLPFNLRVSLDLTSIAIFLATKKINPHTLKPLQLIKHSLNNIGKVIGLSVAYTLSASQLSQFHEREADAISLQKVASIAALRDWKAVREAVKNDRTATPFILDIFSSHPTPESRIAKIDERIQELQALEDAKETK